MSFCYKKILGVFTHLRVTTPNIIEPLIEAVDLAKTYVHEAIVSGVQLNAAFGSVWHEGLLAGGVADNDKKN